MTHHALVHLRVRAVVAAMGTMITLSAAAADDDRSASGGGGAYLAALVNTTLGYMPNGGSFQGPQGDVTPLVGLGYFVTKKIAIELDVGPTFIAGRYAAFGLTPGLLWLFHPNVYAAGRLIVPVHPQLNFALFPGVGATFPISDHVSPFLEVNLLSVIGHGRPDFGIGGSAGALYVF